MEITPEQARTLAAILTHGSFDAAAAHLSVTPSADQPAGPGPRDRRRPARPDPGASARAHGVRRGRGAVRPAAGIALRGPGRGTAAGATPRGTRLTLVINSDSLHTWALAGLAAASDNVQLEILREDQEHSLDLLRAGAAAAAITATAKPVPGCSSSKLGTMRYLPVCAPDFTRRWFGAGVTRRDAAPRLPLWSSTARTICRTAGCAGSAAPPFSRRATMSRPPRSLAMPSAGAWAGA